MLALKLDRGSHYLDGLVGCSILLPTFQTHDVANTLNSFRKKYCFCLASDLDVKF